MTRVANSKSKIANEAIPKTVMVFTSIPVSYTHLDVYKRQAVYLLGLMYFIGQGGFRRIFKHDSDAAASIELVALRRCV